MARPKITLFVDCVSPFAYMAFYALRNFPVFKQCDITYVPIFLGGLMHKCENKTPLYITNKGKWIDLERLRWAKAFDIPVAQTAPDNFPGNTLHVQRALTAVHMEQPDKLADAIAAMYQAYWVERKQIIKPDVAVSVLAQSLQTSEEKAKALFAKGGTADVKAVLAKNTDIAFDDGAFGLPWFIATNKDGKKESFWGFDHIGQVMEHLGLQRPTDNTGWRSML